MSYMIVKWNSEDLKWDVLHYSHDKADAEYWYEKHVRKNPNCKFMIDYHRIKRDQMGERLLAYFDELFGKKN